MPPRTLLPVRRGGPLGRDGPNGRGPAAASRMLRAASSRGRPP